MSRLRKHFFLLVGFFIAGTCCAWTQTKFSATISPGTIGKNDIAELRLMVENAQQVEQINPPPLKDFIIVSGPNQETGMESINGVTRQYTGITYQLKPRATGRFTLAAATARADGKTLKSNPLTVEVTRTASGNSQGNTASLFPGFPPFAEPTVQSSFNDYILKKGESVPDKISKNIFIRVEMNKHSCYVGEPVIVTYKLYTRLKSESSITKNPSFNGFSVIDLLPPGNTYYTVEKLNGREYNVYTLRKSQLYPLQAGEVALESAEVENDIHFLKEEYLNRPQNDLDDMFRNFSPTSIPPEAIEDQKVTLQSKPASILVKPLPDAGKPTQFKGAVGSFVINAALEKNTFTTDDAGKLTVTIAGSGNMPMIIAPDLSWPDGIEPYEARSREQLNKTAVPVSGVKSFEYPFTASRPGHYNLPGVVFSYFDVHDNKYKTVSTAPLSFVISKGSGKRQRRRADPVIVQTGSSEFFDTLFTNRWLIIVPVGICILAGLLIWLQKDRSAAHPLPPAKQEKDREDIVAAMPDAATVHPLSQAAEKLVQRDPGFYQVLNTELKKFIAEKLQVPLATMNKKTVVDEADKAGVDLHTTLRAQQLLDDIEFQLYTPEANEDRMEDFYNRAEAVIHALNETR